ncbi:MAG: hypothetical protein JW765_10215 [Deltaproteobacteria bacterium]|nr:hypothetical protein [Candidatus Zymogenaceae bacterium]
MIVTIGGISARLTLIDADKGRPTDSVGPVLNDRISPFTGRSNRVSLNLTVTRFVRSSWYEILTPKDFTRTQHIIRRIRERFPFTPILFGKTNSHKPPTKAGDISLPLLAAFDSRHVSVIAHPGFLVTVDHRVGNADALVRIDDDRDWETSLIPVFQGVLALCAPDHGALMLHAASLVLAGKGYLFIGNSGAGKSTIAASVDPSLVLSDDGSWCSQNDGDFSLFPTPFSQIDPIPNPGGPVPIERVLFLEKGTQNRIVDLSPGRAMTMLLSNHIHFFRFMAHEPAARAFGLVEGLCRRHPASTLVFTPDFNPKPFFQENSR